MKEKLVRAATHPLTLVSGLTATLSQIVPLPYIDAVISVAWANAGLLFTGVSIGGGQLATRFRVIGPGVVDAAILVAGALFIAKIADKLYDKLQERLQS